MSKKHDHIMLELARLGMCAEESRKAFEELKSALGSGNPNKPVKWLSAHRAPDGYVISGYDGDSEHKCRFMPPGFRAQRRKPDGWRLCYDDDDAPAPLINFCPYCGAQLCEPEIP